MTGRDLINYIQKYHLEDVDIDYFKDIDFEIVLEDENWIKYSFDSDTITLWPSPENWQKTPVEISAEDAMKMRMDNKINDEYMISIPWFKGNKEEKNND